VFQLVTISGISCCHLLDDDVSLLRYWKESANITTYQAVKTFPWIPYDSAQNRQIEEGFVSGKPLINDVFGDVGMNANGIKYDLDFKRMKQINRGKDGKSGTLFEREVKREAVVVPISVLSTPARKIHLSSFGILDAVDDSPIERKLGVRVTLEGFKSVQAAQLYLAEFITNSRVEKKVSVPCLPNVSNTPIFVSDTKTAIQSRHSVEVKSVRHETKNSEYVLYGIARNIFQAESTLNRRIAAAVSDLAPNHGRPPSQWQEQIGDIQRFEVAANSQEWQDVLKSLQTTLPQAKLCSLQRYQNKPMWNLFAATRENVRQALKREDVTKLLFHGTSQTSPDMIFQGGFDRNFGSAVNVKQSPSYLNVCILFRACGVRGSILLSMPLILTVTGLYLFSFPWLE
jgi:hypothetical protein